MFLLQHVGTRARQCSVTPTTIGFLLNLFQHIHLGRVDAFYKTSHVSSTCFPELFENTSNNFTFLREQAPARFICVFLKTIIHRSRVSCLTRSRRDLTSHHLLFRSTFPLYCILLSDEKPNDPRTEGRSGRLALQSPLTGYEPNATVEVSSAEVTPVLLPSRRASFCSVKNSGQDVTTTPVSSEVDERQSMGMLASPLLMQ